MDARKLFIGIAAQNAVAPMLIEHAGLAPEAVNPLLPFHLTAQYCGNEVTNKDTERIARLWTDVLREAQIQSPNELYVLITGEFDLYGKDKNDLVVLCRVSERFSNAVEAARKRVIAELPHVPASDFAFSPHITLGSATKLPKPGKPLSSVFTFDRLTMWGNDGEVRGAIAVPLGNSILGLFQ